MTVLPQKALERLLGPRVCLRRFFVHALELKHRGITSFQVAGFAQPVEQQVNVDWPAVISPASQVTNDTLVIQGIGQPQPADRVVASAHVVSREGVQASQAAQQDVLGRPASDTS
jgi:hypothetical protein